MTYTEPERAELEFDEDPEPPTDEEAEAGALEAEDRYIHTHILGGRE